MSVRQPNPARDAAARPSRDPLTARFPRTSLEAFGTDARSAVAVERHRQPVHRRLVIILADYGAAALIAGGLVVGLLRYFDVLVKP